MAKYRIMTFDGGGIRGALSAELLKRLESDLPQLIKDTHVFAGTSTGSFIALGLAYGLTPKELVEIYTKHSKEIFSPRNFPPLFEPEYSNSQLRRVLSSIFPSNLRLNDLKYNVIIPSFKVLATKEESWHPVFFNNFLDSPTQDEYVVDVALASSAAPIYFPSYNDYIDGGVVANNPSTAALSLVVDEQIGCQDLKDIVLLSFGTGVNPTSFNKKTKNWGLFEWLFTTNPILPLVNLLFDSSVDADDYYTSKLLKDNYYRLNPKLVKSISLDDYNEISNLISMADHYNIEDALSWIKTKYL